MKRQVVSLWLPDFPIDRRLRRWEITARRKDMPLPSGWRDRVLALVERANGGVLLAAVGPAARAAGLLPGLPLAEARALVPGLVTAPADPVGDARALDALAAWCGRYTPWTAVDGGVGAGLWLDITGCGHLFGGEAELLKDLNRRLDDLGYRSRAAAAPTPGAAWALARFGKDTSCADEKALRDRLAPLPTAALRLAPETVEGLARMGLRRIGDLLERPRAPLDKRFGDTLFTRLDQALGTRSEPLSPRRPPPLLHRRLAFAEPIGRPEDITAALERLSEDLCAGLAEARLGTRRLTFTLYRTDGTRASFTVGTSRPVRDPAPLTRLFRDKLKGLDSGFGIEVAILSVTAADPLDPLQDGLLGRHGSPSPDAVALLLDRLGNRLGSERVARLAPRASHLPERACRALPLSTPSPPASPAPRRSRPLHLLPWPEPVEALAPVPDDPPVQFRWRRRSHRVTRAEGPERIGGEWWLNDPGIPDGDIRDYYRVEDADGCRFWLYRQGLYRPGTPPRWYLHGFFP